MPTIGTGPAGWTAENHGRWAKVVGASGATSIAAGGSSACARMPDGRVMCWGCLSARWAHGGRGPSKPVIVPGITQVTEIAMGLSLTCALHVDDSVSCWGVFDGVDDEGTPTRIPL
jgi:hypothetical protein